MILFTHVEDTMMIFWKAFWRMSKSLGGGQVFHLDHVTKEDMQLRTGKLSQNLLRSFQGFSTTVLPSLPCTMSTAAVKKHEIWYIWVSSQVPSTTSFFSFFCPPAQKFGQWQAEKWLERDAEMNRMSTLVSRDKFLGTRTHTCSLTEPKRKAKKIQFCMCFLWGGMLESNVILFYTVWKNPGKIATF